MEWWRGEKERKNGKEREEKETRMQRKKKGRIKE